MAKVMFGSEVVDMRNKVGGHVFSKNRSGSYKRTKVSPVNPQTTYQQQQRMLLGTLSSQWRLLGSDNIAAWNAAAANFPTTDVFGNPITLTGLNLYVQLNKNLLNAGEQAIEEAPSPVALPSVFAISATATADDGVISVVMSDTGQTDVFGFLVSATPPIPVGRSFVKNKFRFIGFDPGATNTLSLTSLYSARFGSLIADYQLFIKIVGVSLVTGQAAPASSVMCIIAAT